MRSPGPSHDRGEVDGDTDSTHGFNRQLRLAERRRSSMGDGKSKTPPAISAVVLDDVDGDVLDASPNRLPGSPLLPSPQRLSIPRTPVSARSLLERSLVADGPPSVPPTPTSTKATSVEVLLRGTMRTTASEWFDHGEAWFPAEVVNLYRPPSSTQPWHPAFENEAEREEQAHEPQVWVQVRVPALLEQALIWVKIEVVRPVKPAGLVPDVLGQEAEVSQILDGRCIWYRGRVVALASGTAHAASAPCVQLFGCFTPRAARADSGASVVPDADAEGGARPVAAQPQCSGPILTIDIRGDVTRRVRRAVTNCSLTYQDASDMVDFSHSPARLCGAHDGLHHTLRALQCASHHGAPLCL